MITVLDLKVIKIEHEVQQGEWLYRFLSIEEGCYVKRVKADNPLWHHSVLLQSLDEIEKKFMPSNVCGITFRFNRLDEAIDFVNAYND